MAEEREDSVLDRGPFLFEQITQGLGSSGNDKKTVEIDEVVLAQLALSFMAFAHMSKEFVPRNEVLRAQWEAGVPYTCPMNVNNIIAPQMVGNSLQVVRNSNRG